MENFRSSLTIIDAENVKVAAISDGVRTAFVGVADNKSINIVTSVNRMSQLLIRAVNNRTRERNYFRLYSQLLEGEITEEDFDKEIDDNENEYVVANNETADKTDIEIALSVSPQLMDVKDVDDMTDIFSFDSRSIRKSISSESHG